MPQAGEKANAGATVGITAYLRRKKEELSLEYILNYKKLTETAKVPTRRSPYAVGYTVYADIPEETVEIPAKGMQAVHTGIAMRLPPYTF